jgi:NAD(P)-dependent dehydrogenase (short-subunit alcohol dehydrogenase family)
MRELEGRVAIITGGASGIGAGTARLFVEAGARVVIGDMQVEKGEQVARDLGDAARFQRAEVSREADVKALVEFADATWGRLDCLFNNAGFAGVFGPIHETPAEEFDLTFAVLTRGVFLGMKHAAPLLCRGGGAIINTASVAALAGGYSSHAYSAAKAAVIQLTRSVALELGPQGVRVNAISPGFIATPLALDTVGRSGSGGDAAEVAKQQMAASQPIQRAGEPEDIGRLALWLASDAATYVTGQNFVVDGGLTAGRPWADQPDLFKTFQPVSVYRPDDRAR